MTLVNDLHWLVREGYVIEFNDGSLDLPRAKPQVAPAEDNPAETVETASSPPEPAIEVVPIASVLSDEGKTDEPDRVEETAIPAVETASVSVAGIADPGPENV